MNKQQTSIDDTSQKDNPPAARDNEELWTRLHEEAQSHYEEAGSNRRKVALWGIVLMLAILVLGASGLGIYQNYNHSRGIALQSTTTAKANSLITAQNNTASVESRSGTDAVVFTEQSQIWGTKQAATAEYLIAKATQVALDQALSIQATPGKGTQTLPIDCQDAASYTVEVGPGPKIIPSPGTRFVVGSQPPIVQASWEIKNTGKCDWVQLALWSQNNKVLTSPVFRRGGLLVTPVVGNNQVLLPSGEQIEIAVVYKPTAAHKVNDEWVFIVNGLSLSDQPHLVLNLEDWVMGITPTPGPTTVYRPKPTLNVPPPRPTVTP